MTNAKIENIKKTVSDAAEDVTDEAEDLVEEVKEKATKVVNKAKGKSSSVIEDAKTTTEDVYEAVCDYVKENPGKSLGIAALIGLVAGYVIRK